MKKTLLSFLFTASSCVAFAQWAQLPGEGGEINDLVNTPGGILLATEGGIFKSIDSGNNWTYSSNGLFAADSSISAMEFASTSTALFVQTNGGIAKTIDNGATWLSAGNTGMPTNSGNFTGLISVGNKLYTCIYTNMNTYQIFTSVNDGLTWTGGANVYSNNDRPRLFNVGGTVYVTKTDSIFTTATGASLSNMSYTGFPTTGRMIEVLNGDATYMYAGFRDGGGSIYRYDIANTTWGPITSGLPSFVFSTGPFLVNNTLYTSVLTMSMTLETYTSATQGNTWTLTSLTGMTKNFIDGIYPIGGSNFLVVNPIDGINISTDNGSTWTQHMSGFKAEAFRDGRTITYSNGNLVVTKDLGIAKSSDGGTNWLAANTGMPSTLFFNFSLYNANNTLYTSFMDLAGGYLYKSTDGANTWTAATLPAGANEISFFGHSNTAVFVQNRNNNTFHRSTDNGGSWTDITGNLNPAYNYYTQFISDGINTYVVGSTGGSGSQIFKSTDDGATWNPISMTGIPPYPNGYIADNLFMAGGNLMSMWVDYSTFPSVYKMCTFTGTNWTSVTVSGLPQYLVNSCMNCNNGGISWYYNASTIYYMTNRGLFSSSDNGATFNSFNSGLYPGVNIARLTSDGVSLYAGTEGNSIWKTAMPVGLKSIVRAESSIDVYPNPASNSVTVSYTKEVVDATSKLIITDMLGAIVQEVSLLTGTTQTEISTSNLKSGIYFYTVSSSSKKSETRKLIISK